VERQNQTIGIQMLKYKEVRASEGKSFNWSDNLVLGTLMKQYNRSYHSTVRMTPYEALFGRTPRNSAVQRPQNLEEAEKLRERYLDYATEAHVKNQSKIAKQSGVPTTFEIGDLVWVKALVNPAARRGKMAKKIRRPGKIIRIHRLPYSDDRTHKYDVELEQFKDMGTRVDEDIRVNDLTPRLPIPIVAVGPSFAVEN
jgi:hypothetical protein